MRLNNAERILHSTIITKSSKYKQMINVTSSIVWTLEGGREADASVGDVELRVVTADEHVAQDPQRTGRRRDVQPHEAGQTHRLTELRHLHTEQAAGLASYTTWRTSNQLTY